MLLIDKYAYTNKLSKLNPLIKCLFCFCIMLCIFLINSIGFNIFITSIIFIILVVIAKIPGIKYLKMTIIPVSFLVMSIVIILISISSDSSIYIYSLKIGNMYIGISQQGLNTSMELFFRVLACISSMYFLSLTTPINQQIIVMRKLKIPIVIIELTVLMYRFIFILLEECRQIYTAQYIRFGYKDIKKSYKSLSLLIKLLFIRVLIRYEDMNIALDNKLYNGKFHF